MKFPFLRFQSRPCPAFPDRHFCYRPVIPIHIYSLDLKTGFQHYALLDTGADYNLLHADLLDVLGVDDVKSGKRQDMFGIEGKGIKTYFHDVIICVGKWRYKTYSGFTDFGIVTSPDQMPYGVLGQVGFFEHFEVLFDYRQQKVELKPKDETNA